MSYSDGQFMAEDDDQRIAAPQAPKRRLPWPELAVAAALLLLLAATVAVYVVKTQPTDRTLYHLP